ncbi:MAG TPA: hypothetical protein VFK27_02995 [Bacillales bacterium]|nr:hypothetical protein [Bacillales bacterium]
MASGFGFMEMHDRFLEEWKHAMAGGDTSGLEEKMASGYFVAFFRRGDEKPMFFNRDEAVEGMRQSVVSNKGAEKHFKNRLYRMRDDRNAVVFYEQIIEKEDETFTRFFTIENWRLYDGGWFLISEVQEWI